jgi:hypothetical protein
MRVKVTVKRKGGRGKGEGGRGKVRVIRVGVRMMGEG